MKSALLVSTVFLISISCGYSARILALYGRCSKSHKIAVMPILEELGRRGHQITLVSPYAPAAKVENIQEIVLEELTTSAELKNINWFEMESRGIFQLFCIIPIMREFVRKAYGGLMNNEEFRSILRERNVDLVIYNAMFTDYAAIIAEHLQVPFVTHNSNPGFPFHLAAMGAPVDYASVPSISTEFDNHMTFFQRLANLVISESFELVCRYAITDLMEDMAREHFPNASPIAKLQKMTSISIINSHPTTNWPRSLPPAVVPVAALHTRPAKSLPEELEAFVSSADDGFIVFTLGSFVPVSSMPAELFQKFLKVFSRIPQKIVWKWEAKPPEDLPSNILMTHWLPQQDLLGHPNVRLFITHGGLMGTQEAVYHGVPLLYLPFGLDQKANARKAEREGSGLNLRWAHLTEQVLYDAINKLINDPSYKANATRLSRLLRDEMVAGKDVAAYWIEYVLRHGGTGHLQVASKDMPFYQRYLLDIIAFFLLLTFLLSRLTYGFIRWIASICSHHPAPKRKVN